MIGRILIGVLILAVIVGVLVLGQGPGASLARKPTGAATDVPGYSARNAEVVETGDDGRPVYTLNARTVRQRTNDSRVQLDGPHMTFVADDGTTWNLTARAGLIHQDGSNVDLFGDVKLDGTVSDVPVTVGTSTISFDTKTEIAHTTAPVTLDRSGGRLGATGLVANLKDSTIRLESKVHGTFPPKTR
jgi:LPS export ABC transporter protein LptC